MGTVRAIESPSTVKLALGEFLEAQMPVDYTGGSAVSDI